MNVTQSTSRASTRLGPGVGGDSNSKPAPRDHPQEHCRGREEVPVEGNTEVSAKGEGWEGSHSRQEELQRDRPRKREDGVRRGRGVDGSGLLREGQAVP